MERRCLIFDVRVEGGMVVRTSRPGDVRAVDLVEVGMSLCLAVSIERMRMAS